MDGEFASLRLSPLWRGSLLAGKSGLWASGLAQRRWRLSEGGVVAGRGQEGEEGPALILGILGCSGGGLREVGLQCRSRGVTADSDALVRRRLSCLASLAWLAPWRSCCAASAAVKALLLQVRDSTGQAGEEAGRVSPCCDFEVVQPLPFDVIRVNVGDHKSERGPIARGGLWL